MSPNSHRTNSTMLIDTHVHLDQIESVERVIQTARQAGIRAVISVGMDNTSNRKVLELADQFAGIVYPAIGYHPWSVKADEVEESIRFIESKLDDSVALGEVGLDYKVKVKKPLQREVFARLLQLAKEKKKPVIVHSRLSHSRTHQMVAESGVGKAVFHWYSGALDILDRILADGFWVSATPALAYSSPHRAAMARAPLERILIETDAPVKYRDKVSEPADLRITLRELSHLKKVPEDRLVSVTTENARRFFGI
jgi:TatD DNase family protein